MREALARGRDYLKRCSVENPFLDAEVLLARVTGLDRAGLYREGERKLAQKEAAAYSQLLARRAAREPVAYLTGEKEFMGLSFLVNPAVLIPRPETELLVENALLLAREFFSSGEPVFLAEAGTGSGAVAVSVASFLPDSFVYATDISPGALAVAEKNAERQGVREKIVFLEGDLLSPLFALGLTGRINIVLANLPYVPTARLKRLAPDVRRYEPLLALDGGPDGLSLYRRLIPQARHLLSVPGWLLVEIGPGQGAGILQFLEDDARNAPGGRPWEAEVLFDYGGRERIVRAKIG